MYQFHELWTIEESSFRAMIEAKRAACGRTSNISTSRSTRGVTDAFRVMCGDGFVPQPNEICTLSIPIDAPSDVVWRWLAQMMRGGGMYGWPALESASCRSSSRCLADLPPPLIGDRCGEVLEIVHVEHDREIVWQATAPIQVFDFVVESLTLDYLIEPIDESHSRLIVRKQCQCNSMTGQVRHYLCWIIEHALVIHQLKAVQSYAEREAKVSSTSIGKSRSRNAVAGAAHHQALPFRPAMSMPTSR